MCVCVRLCVRMFVCASEIEREGEGRERIERETENVGGKQRIREGKRLI